MVIGGICIFGIRFIKYLIKETIMNTNLQILRWSLFAGSAYFFLVAIFHMSGINIPPFFIYYNVPSYAYQDQIISFLAFGWSVFIFIAFLNPINNKMLIQAILVAGVGAVIGLEIINTYTDFQTFAHDLNPTVFRLETLGLAVYLVILTIYYNKSKGNLK